MFSAIGEAEDGGITVEGCDVDAVEGDYSPTPATNDDVCPLTDILDLESVDWCDNYEDNDLCCQVDDPCGYGFDGLCQCADSCEWDVMDCTGAPVGVVVSDADGEGNPGVAGAECVIVNDETGEPVEPEISTISDANGYCWFPSINGAENFSVRVTHDDYLTEYMFNLPSPALPQVFMFAETLIDDFEEYFEIEIDPEDGMVLGFVLWSGEAGTEMVGCAEVTNDSGQNAVYYSDENGPSLTRTSTHPLSASHLLFNVPTGGPYDFTATIDETEVTQTEVPQVFESEVTINYLVYDSAYETIPTPTGCE